MLKRRGRRRNRIRARMYREALQEAWTILAGTGDTGEFVQPTTAELTSLAAELLHERLGQLRLWPRESTPESTDRD